MVAPVSEGGKCRSSPTSKLSMEALRSSLNANKAEKMQFLAANQEAQIELFVEGLQTLFAGQQRLAERIDESERRAGESFEVVARELAAAKQAMGDAIGQAPSTSAVEAIEKRLATVSKQVDTIVQALKVGNRVRKKALSSVKEYVETPKMRRERCLRALQRRFRQRKRKEGRTVALVDEAAIVAAAPTCSLPDDHQTVVEVSRAKPVTPFQSHVEPPIESSATDLDEMMDDGTTTAKLLELEQVMKRRLEDLEQRAGELSRGQAAVASAVERSRVETRDCLGDIPEVVVPIATKTTQDILARELQKNFDGGTSTLELRRDLNALTRFADEMQKRCEQALLAADAAEAMARKQRVEEKAARHRCLSTLHSIVDAAAARRAGALRGDSGSNADEGDQQYLDRVEAVANAALEALARLEDDDAELPHSTTLALRVVASMLDGGLDSPGLAGVAFTTEPFDSTIVNKSRPWTSWRDAIRRRLLPGVVALLDRHCSTTLAHLDVVRLRAEFNCLPRADDDGEESSRFALDADDASLAVDDPWRISERTSACLRGSGIELLAHPSDLAEALRSLRERLEAHGTQVAAARGMAKDSQRHAASLDRAVHELVLQMQQGFASRQDVAQVEEALAQLGERLRVAKSDLESQRAHSNEYADQLAMLTNKLRTASTPDYAGIDKLLARKADVDDILDLKDRLQDALQDQQRNDQPSVDFGAFVTKCLACNRPFGDARPCLPPSLFPPGALVAPGARIPTVMPPSGCGVVREGVGVEMRPTHRDDLRSGAVPTTGPGNSTKGASPPKKTMSLQFGADGVHDSNVVISRSTGRLMPLNSKRVPDLHHGRGPPH